MKDLGALMKQAQAMQQKLADAQAKLAETTVEGTSGGGMVTVTLTGKGVWKLPPFDAVAMNRFEGYRNGR